MAKAKTRIAYRYVGESPMDWDDVLVRPGQFISKTQYDRLPKGLTIEQEIRCGQ